MSGFIRRERAVNTVNPAGGVNPASAPNTGQFGWTKFEANIVNQLIGYVDLANKASEQAKADADYVREQITLVDNYTQFIMDGLEDFDMKYTNSLTMYETLNNLYVNMESIHEAVIIYHDDIVKYSKIAYDSIKEAEGWAYMSYIIYLDTRGELVNGGSWLAQTGQILPSAPTTNTIWTVTTGGQEDVKIGDFIWNEGDHLTYTLREKKFNQVKKSFYEFQAKSKSLMETIADMQQEIADLKEIINGYVL